MLWDLRAAYPVVRSLRHAGYRKRICLTFFVATPYESLVVKKYQVLHDTSAVVQGFPPGCLVLT